MLATGIWWMVLSLSGAAPAEGQPRTWAVEEVFGVSHPDQIIDFDLDQPIDGTAWRLIGPGDQEAAYQLLDNGRKLAVRTDLPAGARRQWRLIPGRPTAADPESVTVERRGEVYEIANRRIGLRVPAGADRLDPPPAPVQGLRFADGTWTATGPNRLSVPARTMTVRFLERGALKTVVEVAYEFDRPALVYGTKTHVPAGRGFYRSRLEVQAGQPSILIEEDTDTDLCYAVDVTAGLEPDRAQYQGHHSTSVEAGREADGRPYRMWHERQNADALVDLRYDRVTVFPFLAHWDPWAVNTGWYWQVYPSQGTARANLLGLFAGRPSRLIGPGWSGVCLFTKPADAQQRPRPTAYTYDPKAYLPTTARPAVGLLVWFQRLRPDQRCHARLRFSWGLYLGVKGEALKPTTEVQPIARQMNLHSGFNLNKIHRYVLDFPAPPQGYGAMYMPRAVIDGMIARLREDKAGPHGKGYHAYLYSAEPYARPLVDFWHDAGGRQAGKVVSEVVDTGRRLLEAFINGQGIYDFAFHYWHGASAMASTAVWIDQLLASDVVPAADKARLRRVAALFGYVLWDDDFVPLHEGHGVNLGTANMPVMQNNARNLYALWLAGHPAMRDRVVLVRDRAVKDLHETVNEHGSHMACTHYIGASMYPLLNTFQQLQMIGTLDAFGTQERLAKFAEFYLHFLTPPEPRFGGLRKCVSIGDGSTEGSGLYGQLATGFAKARPELSARLMAAWRASGAPHHSFQGTSLLKIDEGLPAGPLRLASSRWPGWYTVLRHGWGTPEETAVWFVNGDYQRDHRHCDQGSAVIYALGAPVSIDWGPIYYPQVAGGFMHSAVLPESAVPHPWDGDNPPLDRPIWNVWARTLNEGFTSLEHSAHAWADFQMQGGTTWTRTVSLIHPVQERPIIVIDDRFAGPQGAASKILTWNLMADGPVSTPQGDLVPVPRLWDHYSKVKKEERPSAGRVFPLAAAGRLGFKGQWGVDFDVYVASVEPLQAQVGNWAHTWHPNTEQGQYRAAHKRPFEERQHILRVRGAGAFRTVILPYRRGQRPADLRLLDPTGQMTISGEGWRLTLERGSWTLTGPDGRSSSGRWGRAIDQESKER